MLTVVGGIYLENCLTPSYSELFGSALRATCALGNKGIDIELRGIVGKEYFNDVDYKSKLYGFTNSVIQSDSRTLEFSYFTPLSKPNIYNLREKKERIDVKADNILYYGMIDNNCEVVGNFVVYDPQNHISFTETNSKAQHLAIILNKNEAQIISKRFDDDLIGIGWEIKKSQNAEVVVIKNGAKGAIVFHKDSYEIIPVFETNKVWSIGSGDIFSAVFAWKWIEERLEPIEAAKFASKSVANFCETQQLPLIVSNNHHNPIASKDVNRVYIASPFFTVSDKLFVNEIRNLLIEFGNEVFSPMHDLGLLDDQASKIQMDEARNRDLIEIEKCDSVLAIISGNDPGTIFEIGYALAKGKRVIILAENYKEADLFMFKDTNCEITDDFTTAIYKASW